ncbi:hypothetical protein [Flavobacterium oreochromis]|uniref:Carrier domain-containing protein n=1 Tax=Flavobacterium columnare TaxID=996 RepID=A0A246G8C4_9FLAO|nr:hypothetical protein [Flavobacterium oreochromis]OWP75084.1 hypothetical protein BWK62_12765 [Flavobacterium oreochromis]POR24065.1 hypothetical protein BWK58_08805 [Flavobacterium columnare]QYS86477.1 hypothetical protein JJC03_16560 [Flavobacterium oreochromis]
MENLIIKNEIYNLVVEELLNQVGCPMTIAPGMLIKEDLGLPSMKIVFFLTSITQKLNISILDFADYELLNAKSVQDMYELLTQKIK